MVRKQLPKHSPVFTWVPCTIDVHWLIPREAWLLNICCLGKVLLDPDVLFVSGIPKLFPLSPSTPCSSVGTEIIINLLEARQLRFYTSSCLVLLLGNSLAKDKRLTWVIIIFLWLKLTMEMGHSKTVRVAFPVVKMSQKRLGDERAAGQMANKVFCLSGNISEDSAACFSVWGYFRMKSNVCLQRDDSGCDIKTGSTMKTLPPHVFPSAHATSIPPDTLDWLPVSLVCAISFHCHILNKYSLRFNAYLLSTYHVPGIF